MNKKSTLDKNSKLRSNKSKDKFSGNSIKNNLRKNLDSLFFEHPLKDKAESLNVGIIHKNNFYKFNWGTNYKYFDLASLTKPIFTMSAFLVYEEFYAPVIHKSVDNILPWFKPNFGTNLNAYNCGEKIKVSDLLSHQSGARALYPVYKELEFDTLENLNPLNELIRNAPFDQTTSVYSDVGFFYLGAILEEIYNKPLFNIFEDLRSYFEMSDLHFNPLNQKSVYKKSLYAPTEICKLRNKIIQGEVHDENCWRMGGVGPHAGLFGSLDGVLNWTANIMNVFKVKSQFSKLTSQKFLKKQKGDWRLGLMVPSKPVSSCGQYFSEDSYGHLGFTGTSFWVDPQKDLAVVILSNRTYPDRDNKSFNILRPLIHNTVWETLK